MGTYSIAEAKDRLSKLIRQAEEGEDIAITRHGRVVAHLHSAVATARRRPSVELLARIAERAQTRRRIAENAAEVVRRMRDGEAM